MKDNSGKVNLVVIAVIIMVQMVLVVGVYFLLSGTTQEEPIKFTAIDKTEIPDLDTSPKPKGKNKADEEDVSSDRPSNDNSSSSRPKSRPKGGGGFDFDSGGAKDYIKEYALFSLGDVIVNPTGSDGRFFVTSISLEYKQIDKKLPDELKNKVPAFQHRVNRYFSSQTMEDLRNPEKLDDFHEDVMRQINGSLVEGRITDVFFTQWVIQ